MEQLKETIIKKYKRATKKFIKNELKQHGYILTPEKEILKLDVFNKNWNVQELEQITELINKYVSNWWNIAPETQNEIILNNLIELLPVATHEQLNNYLKYIETSKLFINPKELNKQVKELLKENKKRHNKVNKSFKNNPDAQSQALINNDVFLCGNDYYIIKNNECIKLNVGNIIYYVNKEFGNVQAFPEDYINYMRFFYPKALTKTDLPKVIKDNENNINLLNETKSDYDLIKKFVSSFE